MLTSPQINNVFSLILACSPVRCCPLQKNFQGPVDRLEMAARIFYPPPSPLTHWVSAGKKGSALAQKIVNPSLPKSQLAGAEGVGSVAAPL